MALVIGIIASALALLIVLLPAILAILGLHRPYEGRRFNLRGKRALIITTSHGAMGPNGRATGVFASEMTAAYYAFSDSGVQVDLASIEGGIIPVEPMSLHFPLATEADRRYLKDPRFRDKVQNSIKIDDVNIPQYDLVYIAGGWGAAYDLGQSTVLGSKTSEARAQGIILGSVCHGALGFLQALETDGRPLVEGKILTAVTDRQLQELRVDKTPLHPEAKLKKLGADFKSQSRILDTFASLVVTDKNLVTGQNQNSGAETASRMMALLFKAGSPDD